MRVPGVYQGRLFSRAGGGLSIPSEITKAVGNNTMARDTHITREGFYKVLGERGNPSIATAVKAVYAGITVQGRARSAKR
jgi:DNA-binding phage protein